MTSATKCGDSQRQVLAGFTCDCINDYLVLFLVVRFMRHFAHKRPFFISSTHLGEDIVNPFVECCVNMGTRLYWRKKRLFFLILLLFCSSFFSQISSMVLFFMSRDSFDRALTHLFQCYIFLYPLKTSENRKVSCFYLV